MEFLNEVCQCDENKQIVTDFVPYYFNTTNPYKTSKKNWDDTPCEKDEYPISYLYKKKFRWGDKSYFDTGTTVKLPPNCIEWRIRPIDSRENRLIWPKAVPLHHSVSKGIIPHDRKPEILLSHERHSRLYKPPMFHHMNVVYY